MPKAPRSFASSSTLTSFVLQPGKRQRVSLVAAVIDSSPSATLPAQEASCSTTYRADRRSGCPGWSRSCSGSGSVLGPLRLSTDTFSPSTTTPALLTFRAGLLVANGSSVAVQPVALLRPRPARPRAAPTSGTLATAPRPAPGPLRLRSHRPQAPPETRSGTGRYRIRVDRRAEPSGQAEPSPRRRSRSSDPSVYSPAHQPLKGVAWEQHRLPSRICARTRSRSHASS